MRFLLIYQYTSVIAVQEERQGSRMEIRKILNAQLISSQMEAESTSNYNVEMPPESIAGAEEASEALLNSIKVFLSFTKASRPHFILNSLSSF